MICFRTHSGWMALLLLAASSLARGADWPALFGPQNDRRTPESIEPDGWPADGPRELWRRPVGTGYSSPVVAGGRVVIQDREGDQERIRCMDAATGDEVWTVSYPTTYVCEFEYSHGPYATPLIHEGRVFAFGAQHQLHCIDLESGEIVWRKLLAEDFKVDTGLFGFGCGAVVEGGKLLFNLGAAEAGIVALDIRDGATAWTATNDQASYATPCVATVHGQRIAFFFTAQGLVALAPDTGKVLWSVPHAPKSSLSINATSPVVWEDLVVAVTGPGPGAICVRCNPDGGHEIAWEDRRVIDSQFNTLWTIDGVLYGYTSKQQFGVAFRAIDIYSGELLWEHISQLGRGSGLAAGDKFVLWGERGHLAVLDVDKSEARVRWESKGDLLAPPCYASPALSEGRLYLRDETTLLCLEMR